MGRVDGGGGAKLALRQYDLHFRPVQLDSSPDAGDARDAALRRARRAPPPGFAQCDDDDIAVHMRAGDSGHFVPGDIMHDVAFGGASYHERASSRTVRSRLLPLNTGYGLLV
jgi:hypothetical protein